MQDKDTTYPINDEIDNEIVDKEKDDPNQDCDERQIGVANNKYDQCIDKKWIPLCTKEVFEKLDILDLASTLTILSPPKHINGNNYKINQTQDKIDVFVRNISTKTPFKRTGIKYARNVIMKIIAIVKLWNLLS